MISFNDGDMKFPESELPAVAFDAHQVMYEAQAAGVWVFGGGFMGFDTITVSADGSFIEGPIAHGDFARIGGFCVVDVKNRDEAIYWAAKTAKACRCDQEVREFMDDPEA
ncbi:MAG: hypothetical protein RIS43_651 [Actinomycetota bacterium]